MTELEGPGKGLTTKGHEKAFQGEGNVLILTVLVVIELYTFTKIY